MSLTSGIQEKERGANGGGKVGQTVRLAVSLQDRCAHVERLEEGGGRNTGGSALQKPVTHTLTHTLTHTMLQTQDGLRKVAVKVQHLVLPRSPPCV